jgi:uncharacterized protein (TIRG00374 family)
LLALVVWRIDLAEAFRRIRAIDGVWVAVALGLLTASHFLHALRWWLFLPHRSRLPILDATKVHLLSRLLDTSFSTISGDVLRIELVGRRYHIPRGEVTAAVLVIESILDWTAQVVLIILALFFFTVPGITAQVAAILAVLAGVSLAAAWIVSRADPARDITRYRLVSWLPGRLRQAVGRFVPPLIEGLVTLRRPRDLLRALLITFLTWSIDVAVLWAFGQALDLNLGVHQYFVVLVAVSALQSIPLTPGYLGSYELVVTGVVALQGVEPALAGSFAITTHLLTLSWTAMLALLSAPSLGESPRQFLKQ